MIFCNSCNMPINHGGVATCSHCLDKEKRDKQNLEFELSNLKRDSERQIGNLQQENANLKRELSETQYIIENLRSEINKE